MRQLSAGDQTKCAVLAGVALAGMGAWFWRRYLSRSQAGTAPPKEVMRWENEGGNVPAVVVDAGAPESRTDGQQDDVPARWEFPRSS